MPACTAVYDPNAFEQTGISLFYNTDSAQPAVSLKNAAAGVDPDKDFGPSANDYEGIIVNPSEMASGAFRGFKIVLAMTVPNTTEPTKTTNQISVVSPVYMGLDTNSIAHNKLSLSESVENAWAYYLNGAPGSVVLREFNYSEQRASSYPADGDIRTNSSLASWYDPQADERYVIYQEAANGGLKAYNIITKATQSVNTATNVKLGTSIACVYFEGNVYLYYSDATDTVQRVVRSASGIWGSAQYLRDSPPIGMDQLSVVNANNINHVFYMAREDKMVAASSFSHIRDRL